MEGILFLILWVGCAALHTLFDLKIKPMISSAIDEQTDFPGF